MARVGSRIPKRPEIPSRGGVARVLRDLTVWRDVRAFPPLAVWAGVHCVSAMLLCRRSTDAGALKLTATQIGIAATAAGLLMVAGRAMLARIEIRPPATWLRLVAAFLNAAPIVTLFLGSARRLPLGTATYLGIISLIVGSTTWLWNRAFIERLLTSFLLSPPGAPRSSAAVPLAAPTVVASSESSWRDAAEILRLKRTMAAGGNDRIEGAMIAQFASGQSTATLHIPFLPTFSRAPVLVCEIDAKSAVRIKGSVAYPYGCRVELKRAAGDPAAPLRIEVRFSATLSPASRAA